MNAIPDLTWLKELTPGALIVVTLIVVYLLARLVQNGLGQIFSTFTSAFEKMLEEQRELYQQRVLEVTDQIADLKDRIRELETEGERKDKLIEQLVKKNANLQKELTTLKRKVNQKGR